MLSGISILVAIYATVKTERRAGINYLTKVTLNLRCLSNYPVLYDCLLFNGFISIGLVHKYGDNSLH